MSITDFHGYYFENQGISHCVFRKGHGPGEVILHELPGMTEACIRFAETVAQDFTVHMPLLFGEPGDNRPLLQLGKLCISREFHLFAHGGGSPVTNWLRRLCRAVHAECGGPGVGVVGMCLTGNFAISLMADESVKAPVTAQPALPLGLGSGSKAALAVTEDDLRAAAARGGAGTPLLGLRFSGDRICPPQRFDTLRQTFGAAFRAVEIDSSPGNRFGIGPRAHAVLTLEFVDEEGHPTRQARDRVLGILRERLLPHGRWGTHPAPAVLIGFRGSSGMSGKRKYSQTAVVMISAG